LSREPEGLEALRRRMQAAVDAMDFEEAARLRDRISLLAGNPDADVSAEIDTSRLKRHQPGRMGIGTSDQKFVPPPGWKKPKRPDPMTSAVKPRKGR
jgi:hypothetical protein